MKIEDFRPIRSQDSAPIKFDWLLTQESDWIIWPNQKITLIIFWLVKNGKDWNQAIPLVKRIFLVPDHIWPKTIKGQPALTHVIRNYVLLLVVPPLCLWWVTHIVTKALRLKILPGQQLPLFPTHPTLLTFTKVSKLRVWGPPGRRSCHHDWQCRQSWTNSLCDGKKFIVLTYVSLWLCRKSDNVSSNNNICVSITKS